MKCTRILWLTLIVLLTGACFNGRPAAAQALECHNEYLDAPGGGNVAQVCEYPQKPSAPEEPDVWGALAISPSTLDWGSSWNFSSKRAAIDQALTNCRASPHKAKDCKIEVTFPDICVALAISKPDGRYSLGGPIGAADYADGNALLLCHRAGGKDCAIATDFCADGIRHVVGPRPAAPPGRIRR
jgi:hypothetical protein